MRVRRARHGDAGFHVGQPLHAQNRFHRVIEFPPHAHASRILLHIDAHLRAPLIGRARMERARIRIADDFAVVFRNQIRKLFQRMRDTPGKFFLARHIVFKGNRRLPHIRRIDGKQRRRVLQPGHANSHSCSFPESLPQTPKGN